MNRPSFLSLLSFIILLAGAQNLAAMMDHGRMAMDETGMVMHANRDNLPRDCPKVAADVDITVRAGRKYAQTLPGKMYAFDSQEWNVDPCSRINVTFINDDHIRHQFMIHGLPGYLYPDGMFHMELYGKGELKASFIVPSKPQTYLVHCEVPQHMEKGMKAQLKVAGGGLNAPIPKPDGSTDWRAWRIYLLGGRVDLPSIPGISEAYKADIYSVDWNPVIWLVLLISGLTGIVIPFLILRRK
jgi:hypothetical protein